MTHVATMTLAFGLLRFFKRPPTTLTCIRDARYGILARGLSSPAVSEVEQSGQETTGASTLESPEAVKTRPWTPQSRRTGAIAIKLGMTQLWDNLGEPVPVTVLQVRQIDEYIHEISHVIVCRF